MLENIDTTGLLLILCHRIGHRCPGPCQLSGLGFGAAGMSCDRTEIESTPEGMEYLPGAACRFWFSLRQGRIKAMS